MITTFEESRVFDETNTIPTYNVAKIRGVRWLINPTRFCYVRMAQIVNGKKKELPFDQKIENDRILIGYEVSKDHDFIDFFYVMRIDRSWHDRKGHVCKIYCEDIKRNPSEAIRLIGRTDIIGERKSLLKIRHKLFLKSDYKCAECGRTNKETSLHIDHIIPKAKGGGDEESNLQVLCQDCNFGKGIDIW